MTSVTAETARMEFAQAAARHFESNPKHWSFGDIGPGNFLALRWGLGDDCVLVIRQHDDEEPVNFQQIVAGVKRPTYHALVALLIRWRDADDDPTLWDETRAALTALQSES